MSTPLAVAEPGTQLTQDSRPVDVVYADRTIGSGTMTTTESGIEVNAHYQWPPDAPAEVRASFVFDILTSDTCKVEVNWPGLLARPIPLQEAGYIMLLLMARPDFVISTQGGDHVGAVFIGPMGQPEISTGLQVSATLADGSSSASLVFRYQR